MFVGLTISNLEPENITSTLRRPLLSSDEREVSFCNSFSVLELVNPLSPDIKMHILLSVLLL